MASFFMLIVLGLSGLSLYAYLVYKHHLHKVILGEDMNVCISLLCRKLSSICICVQRPCSTGCSENIAYSKVKEVFFNLSVILIYHMINELEVAYCVHIAEYVHMYVQYLPRTQII